MVFVRTEEDAGSLRPIFSRQNARPVAAILIIHTAFLVAIICLVRLAFRLFSLIDFDPNSVPMRYWDFQPPGTAAALLITGLFFYGLTLLRKIERNWVYVSSGMEPSEIVNNPLEDETAKDQ
jgi:hypothetical protein